MKIIIVGLNHKTAPVDIREKLAFDAAGTIRALRQLKNRFSDAEFVLLSTCNRVELYIAGAYSKEVCMEAVTKFLSEFHNVELRDFQDFLYVHSDEDAVRHLLTVASSLDSMVVGETQIIGQVKESYKLACTAKSTGKILNRLFHCAFGTSKKIYTDTSIANGRISIAGIAVELAMQLFADISAAKVIVIGAGEMGGLLVRHLSQVGSKNMTIVNRSYERGLNLAKHYDIKVREWEELVEQVTDADIVIASAATKDYLFKKDEFIKIMDNRWNKALLVVDIAVPRNFEPSINEIENVYLYSIDELSAIAEKNRKAREEDIAKGLQIAYENANEFMNWVKSSDIGPLIGQMQKKFTQIGQTELERFFVGARQEASCKDSMEAMVNRIVNRLLHCIIKNVDMVAKEHGPTEAAKLVDSIVRHAEEISAEANNKDNTNS